MENVIELLQRLLKSDENELLFIDSTKGFSRKEVYDGAMRIASSLLQKGIKGEPVLVRVNRSVNTLIAFLGIAASGNYYLPVDLEIPSYRLDQIISSSKVATEILLTDVPSPVYGIKYADMLKEEVDKEALTLAARDYSRDDPLMLLYTSGSTGVPKGVLKSHRSFLSFCRHFALTFPFFGKERLANQAPFYFDASNKDIYLAMYFGARLYIPSKNVFALPPNTIDYLNENKITAIFWVPSCLTLIAKLKTLKFKRPEYLKLVFFVGEAFLPKYLNYWLSEYPEARYFNLYGSTEISGVCLYKEITGHLDEESPIPTGKPLVGNTVYLDEGEIVVSSPQLAIGYLGDKKKNAEVFRIGPGGVRELHTGDFGTIDENGDIVFLSRRDYQVKHMGYRIELQEVEVHLSSLPYVDMVCCLLNEKKDQIIAFCTFNAADDNLAKKVIIDAKEILPAYMVPNKVVALEAMPLNDNGKIDRALLKKKMEEQ